MNSEKELVEKYDAEIEKTWNAMIGTQQVQLQGTFGKCNNKDICMNSSSARFQPVATREAGKETHDGGSLVTSELDSASC